MSWYNSSSMCSQSNSRQTADFILSDEKSFYYGFKRDLAKAQQEVIIESPFITVSKIKLLKADFQDLIKRKVAVFVLTRHPEEHDEVMAGQSEAGIRFFEQLGVQVLMVKGHHRKIAMIDRKIVWKGSLNILSHNHSREFMEREEDEAKAKTLFTFLKYDKISDINNHLLQ